MLQAWQHCAFLHAKATLSEAPLLHTTLSQHIWAAPPHLMYQHSLSHTLISSNPFSVTTAQGSAWNSSIFTTKNITLDCQTRCLQGHVDMQEDYMGSDQRTLPRPPPEMKQALPTTPDAVAAFNASMAAYHQQVPETE